MINLHQFVEKLIIDKEKEENDIFSLQKKRKKKLRNKKTLAAAGFDDSGGSQKSGSTNVNGVLTSKNLDQKHNGL